MVFNLSLKTQRLHSIPLNAHGDEVPEIINYPAYLTIQHTFHGDNGHPDRENCPENWGNLNFKKFQLKTNDLSPYFHRNRS